MLTLTIASDEGSTAMVFTTYLTTNGITRAIRADMMAQTISV